MNILSKVTWLSWTCWSCRRVHRPYRPKKTRDLIKKSNGRYCLLIEAYSSSSQGEDFAKRSNWYAWNIWKINKHWFCIDFSWICSREMNHFLSLKSRASISFSIYYWVCGVLGKSALEIGKRMYVRSWNISYQKKLNGNLGIIYMRWSIRRPNYIV